MTRLIPWILVGGSVACTSDVGFPGATGVGNPGGGDQQTARGEGVVIHDAFVYAESAWVELCDGARVEVPIGQEVDLIGGDPFEVPGGEWCGFAVTWRPPMRIVGEGKDEDTASFDLELAVSGVDLTLPDRFQMDDGHVILEVGFEGWIDKEELDLENVDDLWITLGDPHHSELARRADRGSALYVDENRNGVIDLGERVPLGQGPLHVPRSEDGPS